MKSNIFKLDNGITVIYQKHKSKNSACIINFAVGSLYENANEYGLAHFVEHLMFKATSKLSTKELLEALEINGASISASTSFERTIFFLKTNTQYLQETLDLFVDMLNDKCIPEKEFEKEKSVVLQELRRDEDMNTRQNILNWCKQNMNINPVIGLKDDIENMTLKDVENWIKKYFITENMTISICSNKYLWQIKRILNKSFKNFRTGNEEYRIKQENKLLRNIKFKNIKKIFKEKDTKQTQILMNFPIKVGNYNDYVKFKFLNGILSGSLTSIFFKEIRDKYGYVYNISSSFFDFTNDKITEKTFGPYLEVMTSCTPVYVEDCVKQISCVIKNLNKIITDDDFKKVKNRIKSIEPDCLKIARHNMSMYRKYKKAICIERYNKDLININKEDIIEFVSNNINKKPFIALYGSKIKK